MLNSSVFWCIVEDLVGLNYYVPCLSGALGGTTGCLEIRKLSLMSLPQNVQ